MSTFGSFHGIITKIEDMYAEENIGCNKMITVDNGYGAVVNFVVTPDTYFVDNVMVNPGDMVTGFYDANAPAIMIYPPQYPALVMVKDRPAQSVKVDYFNSYLVSSDNTLKLNLAPWTIMILENGQAFTQSPANHILIVLYSVTTMSIPAQTTPNKIIVMCPVM